MPKSTKTEPMHGASKNNKLIENLLYEYYNTRTGDTVKDGKIIENLEKIYQESQNEDKTSKSGGTTNSISRRQGLEDSSFSLKKKQLDIIYEDKEYSFSFVSS